MATVLTSVSQFLELTRQSGLVEDDRLAEELRKLAVPSGLPEDPKDLAAALVQDGLLTNFQASQLLQGKTKGFIINDRYKVLEILGAGGMGKVFLCEHVLLKRLVALKILPFDQVDKPSSLERFYREARALAALDHPNIVRAHDMDRDRKLHFLVMEYVDGASLQDVVNALGPLDEVRAAHYISQAAMGLQHAHEAGWVHRDIKPGNILLDRLGTVKILDMGLAFLFQDSADNLTRMYDDQCVLGTADYLSPEQGLDSHDVDIRSDIYSLGATLYFILCGKPPFDDSNSLTRKLLQHQMHDPKPLRSVRPEVSPAIAAVVAKMMAKDPAKRYQVPVEVAEALAAWTQKPVEPLELSMVQHCAAIQSLLQSNPRPATATGGSLKPLSNGPEAAKPTATRTPPPRTPTPRTPTPRTPLPKGPRTPPRSQRQAVPRESTATPVEDESTAKTSQSARRPKKRARSAHARPKGIFRYLPAGVRRNWPAYAGAGLVVAACLLVMLVWQAVRKHPDGTGSGGDEPASAAQNRDTVPMVDHLPLVTPDDAGKYVNQVCMIEMPVLTMRRGENGELYLNSESNPGVRHNVAVVLRQAVVAQYARAGLQDLEGYFRGKTIRASGRMVGTTKVGPYFLVAEDADHIWFATPIDAIRPADAGRYVNMKCAVDMVVQSSGQSKDGNFIYLNSEARYDHARNFTVVIPRRVADLLQARGVPDPQTYYRSKTIRVTGLITLYRGRPQIELTAPDQLSVMK